MHYKIIERLDAQSLAKAVNMFIKDGYIPLNGVLFAEESYHQTMIKQDNHSTKGEEDVISSLY